MKKIVILFTLICLSFYSFSQNFILLSKYTEICSFNYIKDDYIVNEEMWTDTKITAYDDYCIITEVDDETKVFWEINVDETNDEYVVYYTEANSGKIIFDITNEQILIFYNYNKSKDRYEDLFILSKVTEP